MSKVTIKEWYKRVEASWPDGELPTITPVEAERAARRLYRFAMKRKWTGEVRITSGRRYTWVSGGVLVVNPDQGWNGIVHLLSHYFHTRLKPLVRPHGGEHARLERRLIKEVLRRGWLSGSLKSKPRVESAPPAVDKLERARTNLARAVTRAKRAQTILKKWERRVRRYETKGPPRRGPGSPSVRTL